MQFGAKPLFENVSVKFGGGNRYGLIGANGCGKSTFMKILGGDLEPGAGSVAIDSNERVGKLRQDQFAYETERVLDVVMHGPRRDVERDARARRDLRESGCRAKRTSCTRRTWRRKYAEYGGYTAEARAGELLLGLGVPTAQHDGPMSAVAPGWKLRVLLAQALFGDPDILLLDEPTNNLDINSIRWLEDVLNRRTSTMVIISHDRHFLSSVCTHMADVDYGGIRVYPGSYDDYMEASTLAQAAAAEQERARQGAHRRPGGLRAPLPRPQGQGAPGHLAHEADREAEGRGREALEPAVPVHPLPGGREGEAAPPGGRGEGAVEGLRKEDLVQKTESFHRSGREGRDHRAERRRQDVAAARACSPRSGRRRRASATGRRTRPRSSRRTMPLTEWMGRWRRKDQGDDDQIVRATLGQLLFSGDDQKKSVKVISGGEAQRMLIGKLVLQMPNVMLLDEPTNHLDMESIESLNTALEKYPGTLVFVSHDREFVSSLATRVIELKPGGDGKPATVIDYRGGYEDYLASQEAVLATA